MDCHPGRHLQRAGGGTSLKLLEFESQASGEPIMTTTAKLYYLAATLAISALVITVVDGGFSPNEYFHVGFLTVMAAGMVWLGSRNKPKMPD